MADPQEEVDPFDLPCCFCGERGGEDRIAEVMGRKDGTMTAICGFCVGSLMEFHRDSKLPAILEGRDAAQKEAGQIRSENPEKGS